MSSAKEVFFINSGKKILRIAGIAVSGLLGLLCVLMIVTAAAFGSANIVRVFGFNLFICDSSDYDSVPAGSAVITTSCAPYDLEEGNLVLYSTDPMDKNAPLAMGYYSDFKLTDGVYYLSLVNGTDSTVISENAMIGKAGWCSPFLGTFITFTKTPWGIFVMAVLPCALLILCDFLRTKSAEKPIPEIVPQVKNHESEPLSPQFTVNSSGSASFLKEHSVKKTTADSILFTYGEKKEPQPKSSVPSMSDADVLSLLNSPLPKKEEPAQKPAAQDNAAKLFEALAKTAAQKKSAPEKPTLPAPVAAKRYIDSTVNTTPSPETDEKAEAPVKLDKSSAPEVKPEIKSEPKKSAKRPDAFFAQSEAPQIGRGLAGKQTGKSNKSIIDLEDALATAPTHAAKPEGSRRSADILAAKNRRDLIADDDDSRDKSRYAVDDILAGIEKRHRK